MKHKAPFKVGMKLRYVGRHHYLNADGSDALKSGMVGEVTECRTGYEAHTHDFGDGPEHVPAMDDWSVVVMPSGFGRAVSHDSRNDWEKI